MILHVTNGHGTSLTETTLGGEVLFWEDVLHEGPVPGGLPADALRDVRAEFIASRGWVDRASVERSFRQRDDVIARAHEFEEIVLWFEFDLYDQLQILQILDRLGARDAAPPSVSMICLGEHPDVQDFRGLGQLSPDQLTALFPSRTPVAPAQYEAARRAWHAFTAPGPQAVSDLASRPVPGFPFLQPALRRLEEQFPWTLDGLTKTERSILAVVERHATEIGTIFRRAQASDAVLGLGDLVFVTEYLKPLTEGNHPLLARDDGAPLTIPLTPSDRGSWQQKVEIRPAGADALAGRRDACTLRTLDRWYGGVHLHGSPPSWRYDPQRKRVVPT